MLNNGQKVFVPGYGAGIMTKVKDGKNCSANKIYVSISFLLDNIDIYVPEDKLVDYKVRNIVSKDVMEKALQVIKERPVDIEKRWSKRYRQNNDKIKEGNPFKQCEVIRDLYYLKAQGTLPPGEKKILSRAEQMLASEMMLIFDITMEDALQKIRNLVE